MKAKRAKQYRKLMQQYALTFGVREPYQVLVDADMIRDAERFKMDLVKGLERTLCGKVKPMITQCCIRHLYDATPKDENLIAQAKTFERRRCNHPIDEPSLSTLQCIAEVVDGKNVGANKFHYVVASQDDDLRARMRQIPGVPLIYIKRSIMILEPMAGVSADRRAREERGKFREGVARTNGRGAVLGKRSRDGEGGDGDAAQQVANEPDKKRKKKGPKGPNPLSMRKPKVRESKDEQTASLTEAEPSRSIQLPTDGTSAEGTKKKRKRKHKDKIATDSGLSIATAGDMSDG